MLEGKGRGIDDTFRLSTLDVVVIFLPEVFLVVFGDLCDLRSWLSIDRQCSSLVGALLSRAWCMLVSGMSRNFLVFGPQTCTVPTACQLFVPMVEGYDRSITGDLHYIVQFITLY
ncbi:hypothetical protein TIFTF001_045741 [Ficus carica]|uniref:Uncharacterized protein n=1 Tax=Ficus carica TaxID=3494 RepID=A0AA88CJ38_FICCA|nr:hypothetical protein TIFTF001_045738 [Ficus carica]GMN22975.1 hypothetical protein TIFTF001_045741 [Ficus carica]